MERTGLAEGVVRVVLRPGDAETFEPVVFANVILASFPIVVLYLCMQKQFMSGLTAGAVKG